MSTTHAVASFQIKDWIEWAEQLFHTPEDTPKLVRTTVSNAYTGDIEGEGRAESVMVYLGDGTARYTGLERVTGTVGGRSGSFVLHQTGEFADGKADTRWTVVPGSGTGELTGLRGEGGYLASEGRDVPGVTLDYYFE